jgi:hypothetical protein
MNMQSQKTHTQKTHTEQKKFNELVHVCGKHLLKGLYKNDFTGIATFSLAMTDYLHYGGTDFTTLLTVHIMQYITERSAVPAKTNMKIVAHVNRKDEVKSSPTENILHYTNSDANTQNAEVHVSFRWLTQKTKKELKKNNPYVVELCWICKLNKPATDFKRCGGCRIASYCSTQCQRMNWPEHRHECATLAKS